MAYKLTEIVKGLYDEQLAHRGVAALTGGTKQMEAVIVTTGGSGYSSAPAVGYTGGGGTGAAGTAIVQNGVVVAVTITNRGSGYTSTPGVTFTGGGGAGAAGTALMRATALDGFATAGVTDLPMPVRVDVSGLAYLYKLQSGTDAESSPLVVRPDDYAATTNEKVWKLQGLSALNVETGQGGFLIYNSTDRTTNYERLFVGYVANEAIIRSERGGSGTSRPLTITHDTAAAFARIVLNNGSANGFLTFEHAASGAFTIGHRFNGTSTLSSSSYNFLLLAPIINQSSSAGYRAIRMDVTETTIGSGEKWLELFTVNGAGNHRWGIWNTGKADATGGIRLRAQAAEGTPDDGHVWNDSTQKALGSYLAGVKQIQSAVLFTQTAQKAFSNTTTATTLFGAGVGTLTAPANFFMAGKTVRVCLKGTWGWSTGTVTITLSVGASNLAEVSFTPITGFTGKPFRIEADITCRSTGSPGTLITSIMIDTFRDNTTHGSNYASGDVRSGNYTTTGSGAIDVKMQFGTAHADNAVNVELATVEVLN